MDAVDVVEVEFMVEVVLFTIDETKIVEVVVVEISMVVVVMMVVVVGIVAGGKTPLLTKKFS